MLKRRSMRQAHIYKILELRVDVQDRKTKNISRTC